jgi:hypothetical protein
MPSIVIPAVYSGVQRPAGTGNANGGDDKRAERYHEQAATGHLPVTNPFGQRARHEGGPSHPAVPITTTNNGPAKWLTTWNS